MYDSFDLRQCCYPLATYTAPNRHPLQDFESFTPSGTHSMNFLISAMFKSWSQKSIFQTFFGLLTHSRSSIRTKEVEFMSTPSIKFYSGCYGTIFLLLYPRYAFLLVAHKHLWNVFRDNLANFSLCLIVHMWIAVKRPVWTSLAISDTYRQGLPSLFLLSSHAREGLPIVSHPLQ